MEKVIDIMLGIVGLVVFEIIGGISLALGLNLILLGLSVGYRISVIGGMEIIGGAFVIMAVVKAAMAVWEVM